jgi:dipeptidyl aminopeptidase/acylaminoacyl peptidase
MTESHSKRPIKAEDLFHLKSLLGAKFSPDGKRIVYCVSTVDLEKDEEHASLWLMNVEDGKTIQLTSGVKKDYSPSWSPDGMKIAFLSTRDVLPRIYTIDMRGGEARLLSNIQQPVGSGPCWSPDGKWIAYSAGNIPEEGDALKKPYRINRHVYRFDSVGYLHRFVQNVYIISAEGGNPRQLTHDEYVNLNPKWSPDGQEILYAANFNPQSHIYVASYRLVETNGNSHSINGLENFEISDAAWAPDGRHILFVGKKSGTVRGTKNDLWVTGRHGGEVTCRSKNLAGGVGAGVQPDFPVGLSRFLTADKKTNQVYVEVLDWGRVNIYKIALEGDQSCSKVTDGDQSAVLCDMHADKILYGRLDMFTPPELNISDLDGKNASQCTHLNDGIVSEWIRPKIEHLVYPGAEGVTVEGWLMKPIVGEPPYPTILYIHGGPNDAFGHTFTFDFQLLAANGYAVIYINPQGSEGYGNEFAANTLLDWGNRDYRDLMLGIDLAIEKGWTDPNRLGVSGISYGGYMTSWIIGQTDRFKAAIPENPVTDLVSLYGTSDIAPWVCELYFGGKPQETPEIYRKCSPVTYAHRCTTPTLIIQGEMDYRCPVGQSEELYAILKANGCLVEMARVPGGSHPMSIMGEPGVRKYQNEIMLNWFDRFVKSKTVID